MPNPVFPPSITANRAFLLGYNETKQPNEIVSSVDAGLSKKRKRFEKTIRVVSGQLYLNAEQKTDFDDFYDTNVAARFDWIDPDDSSAVECRFVGAPPAFNRVSTDLWLVNFSIEVIPA